LKDKRNPKEECEHFFDDSMCELRAANKYLHITEINDKTLLHKIKREGLPWVENIDSKEMILLWDGIIQAL
jgi:hypothetical protein